MLTVNFTSSQFKNLQLITQIFLFVIVFIHLILYKYSIVVLPILWTIFGGDLFDSIESWAWLCLEKINGSIHGEAMSTDIIFFSHFLLHLLSSPAAHLMRQLGRYSIYMYVYVGSVYVLSREINYCKSLGNCSYLWST